MSPISNSDAKERIRQAIDIVDLVGGYLALRRQGRNFVGLCPWHNDTRPSMQVNQQRQSWKCWVCDKGGDIFTFVMEKERIGFREALQLLADRAGIALESQQPRTAPGSPDDKKTLLECCAWAEKQFYEYLLQSESAQIAREYFEERGIARESVDKFKLGFAPNEWQWLVERARRANFAPAVLEATGLCGRSEKSDRLYDRFKGRVIFPIHDPQGRCIAFGGRVLPQWAAEMPAKYINSPETKLFSKSDQLYALDLVRNQIGQSRSITVVEGYTDVVMCHQYGIQDVVACLGTALNERHIALIKRFADRVNLVLDGDEAGKRRTNEILDLFLAADFELRILTLPEEFDPCEFLLERSADEWRRLAESKSVDALQHVFDSTTQGIDLVNNTQAANRALQNMLARIAKAPQASLDSPRLLREKQILAQLAWKFGVDVKDLTDSIAQIRKRTKGESRQELDEPPAERATYSLKQLSPTDSELLELMTRHPEVAPTALAEIADGELSSDPARIIFQTYRRLEEGGESLDFGRVLSELEDPQLQNILVAVDDTAERKEPFVREDPATRLRGVINFIQRRYEDHERREKLAELHKSPEDVGNLQEILERAKRRHQG